MGTSILLLCLLLLGAPQAVRQVLLLLWQVISQGLQAMLFSMLAATWLLVARLGPQHTRLLLVLWRLTLLLLQLGPSLLLLLLPMQLVC